MSRRFTWLVVGLLSFSVVSVRSFADDNSQKVVAKKEADEKSKVAPKKKNSKSEEEGEIVELFDAMDQGLVAVDFVPKDSTQANVIFRNKSEKPIRLKLPATFGAVPALAQGGMGMGMGAGGMGGMGGGGMGGGGMGGGGMGGGGQGMGGGMFRVEPDQPRKMKVAAVCLEHGKRDPNPRMKYKLVRLEQVNGDARVAQICEALGKGQLPQNTAQAAAWHFTDGLSWEELSKKPRVISEYTGIELWFSAFEIQNAMKVAGIVEQSVGEATSKHTSGGTGTSEGTGK